MRLNFTASVDHPLEPSQDNYLKLLRDKAVTILADNIYTGAADSGYTAASGKTLVPGQKTLKFLYPFQWLWDTFFIAAWSQDIDQNITDINKFLASQHANGFLGHIRYNRDILARKEYFPSPEIYYPQGLPQTGEITSKITQPPNAAYGVWHLAQKIEDVKKRRAFLTAIFPKIYAYHQYLYNNLVTDGLMVTIHPWQSGDDNSPKWDKIYRAIRKRGIHKKVTEWLETLGLTYDRVDVKIIHHSQWNETSGMYSAFDLNSKMFMESQGIGGLIPLFSQGIPAKKAALLAQKIKKVDYDNPIIYLVPSTFPGESTFEPIRYWRGPVWIIINALIADGLYYYGYPQLAKKVSLSSLKLVYQSLSDNGGFYEYFDPLTGRGLGSPLQSWTAAAVIFLTDLLGYSAQKDLK